MSAPRVLLTVAGRIPAGLDAAVASGVRPRADYRELAAACGGADVLDHDGAIAAAGSGRFIGRLIGRLAGPDAALAVACWRRRHRYDVVFTDSERVGFVYAALTWPARRRPRHVMIAHRLSPPKKRLAHRLLGLRRRIDHVFVYSSAQHAVAVDALGYRPGQVTLTSFMVDTEFWRAGPPPSSDRPVLCAVGQELRDYPTLVAAVRDLDVDVVIAAASPWSRRSDSSAGIDIPANVEVVGLDLAALRELYSRSTLVVVPVVETDFQAGITSILEAMSMERPVIVSRTTGQTDTIADGETGVYVPPGDVAALRAAISGLLADPEGAAELARSARQWVAETAEVERYAARLAAIATAGIEVADG